MHAAESTNIRMAALALHALSAKDLPRVWARLDEATRSTLSPLLDELKELGIPKGREWLACEEQAEAAVTPALHDEGALRTKAWRLRPRQVLSSLSEQSLDTVVCVLQIAPWPWRAEVISNWPPEQRHALRDRLEVQQQVPARLADQMLRLLLSACQIQPAASTQEAMAHTVRRPWYRGFMSLFMLS